ncbi:hypothetical protein PIB30_037716 [Stylosanthes scabra]|uniref:Uncharacterized protein n=1 Tax=Stylosanthes scabra TaxID=79078 RepID=A0ABU6ZCG3_9FABA|nr:hypothetical protein [Stylosanthes scabra]
MCLASGVLNVSRVTTSVKDFTDSSQCIRSHSKNLLLHLKSQFHRNPSQKPQLAMHSPRSEFISYIILGTYALTNPFIFPESCPFTIAYTQSQPIDTYIIESLIVSDAPHYILPWATRLTLSMLYHRSRDWDFVTRRHYSFLLPILLDFRLSSNDEKN